MQTTIVVTIHFTAEIGDYMTYGPFDSHEEANTYREFLRSKYDACFACYVTQLSEPRW